MKRVLLFLIILFSISSGVFGGNSKRSGTSGALELTIPVGSRGTGMGGSVVADVKGVEAMYWNPAGVSQIEGTEVVFSYLDYIADIKYSYLGIATSLGDAGAFGFNARVMNVGDIIVTTEESPNGTGEIIAPTFMVVGVTYSRQMTDRVFFGSSFSVIHERIKQETARGAAFDFGFQYIPGIGGLKLGVVMKNIGPKIKFDGSDLDRNIQLPGDDPQASHRNMRLELSSFEIPAYLQFGTSYDLKFDEQKKVIFTGSFRNNNFSGDELSGGMEFSYREQFMLRCGYRGSSDDEYIYGFHFGLGLRFDVGTSAFLFDYSHAQTRYFDNNQWFTFTFQF